MRISLFLFPPFYEYVSKNSHHHPLTPPHSARIRTQEEVYQHLVLCSKGSAAGEWNVEGMWPGMDDLYGMETETIRLKCKDVYKAMDAKKEGKVVHSHVCLRACVRA